MNRVQRIRGVALPPQTRYVGRGSRWGNPFRLGETDLVWDWSIDRNAPVHKPMTLARVMERYDHWLKDRMQADSSFLDPLRGYHLACWCPLTTRMCHAVTLLDAIEGRPVLPSEGRIVFGVHRQPEPDADTAPAWTPDTDAARDARFRRWAKGAKVGA